MVYEALVGFFDDDTRGGRLFSRASMARRWVLQ